MSAYFRFYGRRFKSLRRLVHNKMRGGLFVIMYVAVSVLISGCYNVRFAAIVEAPDVGPNVITKYKYRLAEYYFVKNGSFVRGSFDKLKSNLERFYPNVFSDSGIPFALYESASFDSKSKYEATMLLYIFSCGTLPYCQHSGYREKFTVVVKNGQKSEKASITGKFLTSSALTCYTPIALACFNDPPMDYGTENQRCFWNTIAYGSNKDKFKINHQAIAYGLAIRLREMELAGKVEGLIVGGNTQRKGASNDVQSEVKDMQADRKPKSVVSETPSGAVAVSYDIVSCEREVGNDFSYKFELKLKGEKSLKAFRSVQKEFRATIKEDYAESFPGVKQNSLFVDFPEYKLSNGKIEGRAVVLSISVTSLTYDPNTRTGKLAVKVNATQYEEARKWIRKNIETLARDKNIALTTGEIPPAAKFYLGREELKDGNVLEIEFRTE